MTSRPASAGKPVFEDGLASTEKTSFANTFIPAGHNRLQLLPFLAFFIALAWFTRNLPFFWDKDILFSRISHWLLLHPGNIILPTYLDPGYPTALAWLLAAAWKIFGTSLPVMHLLMLPFTLGVVWQSRNLIRQFIPERFVVPSLILVLIDTTFLAQTVVFSTDLVMLFFMLLAINSMLLHKNGWLAVAVVGLVGAHMRGVAVAGAIGLFTLFQYNWKKPSFSVLTLALPYVPGIVLFSVWSWYHWSATGWIGYHPGSPWAGCYERVDLAGLFRNILIVGWRLADFGRIFPLAFTGVLLFKYVRSVRNSPSFRQIVLLLALFLLVTLPPMLGYKLLNGHRYLIPVYFMLSLLTAFLLFNLPLTRKWKRAAFVVVVAGMLSGNFWVYPDGVAKGWDATLAHLPWHSVRQHMFDYMESNNIPVEETGSRTPNTSVFDDTHLNGDLRSFHTADLKSDRFVFYTNISNMFTDEEIDALKKDWTVVKEFRKGQVRAVLYTK
jgi:hypothetical protein